MAKISVYNKGPRTFHTSAGELSPGLAQELEASEAANLLGYPELVDLAKFNPNTGNAFAELKEKCEKLTAENEKLKAELGKAKSEDDEPAKPAKKK